MSTVSVIIANKDEVIFSLSADDKMYANLRLTHEDVVKLLSAMNSASAKKAIIDIQEHGAKKDDETS